VACSIKLRTALVRFVAHLESNRQLGQSVQLPPPRKSCRARVVTRLPVRTR
jgi:hypothetical protein